jgi:AraC family transcriptional regulator
MACMSRHHFARTFKSETGKTPMRCLAAARVSCVKRKLAEASSNIAEISVSCGFSSQSHMTRAFRAETGETPAVFQRRELSRPG